MPFLQFTLDIGSRDPEPYEEALFAHGALSVTLLDAADDPVLEPAPGAMPLWPTVVVQATFGADADIAEIRAALCATPGLDPLLISAKSQVDTVADRAWEREWLKDFHPMRFGRRLWICPGGQSPPEQSGVDEPICVELDPGLAFGTGTHANHGPLPGMARFGRRRLARRRGRHRLRLRIGHPCHRRAEARARRAVAMDIDPKPCWPRSRTRNATALPTASRSRPTRQPARRSRTSCSPTFLRVRSSNLRRCSRNAREPAGESR